MNMLKEKFEKQKREAEAYLDIIEKYPDLSEQKDHYGQIRLTSKLATKECNEVEFESWCDCCPDAKLLAYPYFIINNVKIYSDPCGTTVGYRRGSGYKPLRGWSETFIENDQFQDIVIGKIDIFMDEGGLVYPDV